MSGLCLVLLNCIVFWFSLAFSRSRSLLVSIVLISSTPVRSSINYSALSCLSSVFGLVYVNVFVCYCDLLLFVCFGY